MTDEEGRLNLQKRRIEEEQHTVRHRGDTDKQEQQETTEQTQVRLENQCRRVRQSRALESNEKRWGWLEIERSCGRQAWARECVDSRQERLWDTRSHMRTRLQAETDEERQARRTDMSIHMRDRLEEETDKERQARLADLSIRMRDRLEEETDEERQARLADLLGLGNPYQSMILAITSAITSLEHYIIWTRTFHQKIAQLFL